MSSIKLDPWSKGRQTAGEAYLSADPEGPRLPTLHAAVTGAVDPASVIFVDAAQRLEASGLVTNDEGIDVSADFITLAAGAAITHPATGKHGSFLRPPLVRRYMVSSGFPSPLTTNSTMPIAYEHLPAADGSDAAATRAISCARASLELRILQQIHAAHPEAICVLDGPIPEELTGADWLIGWIKSTQMFPTPRTWLGELATMTSGMYSETYPSRSSAEVLEWFVAARDNSEQNPTAQQKDPRRTRRSRAFNGQHETAHLVRLQTTSTDPARVKALQEWSSVRVPQFMTRPRHSGRSPQQPLAVEALEQELRRYMGDPTLIRQGIRVHQARSTSYRANADNQRTPERQQPCTKTEDATPGAPPAITTSRVHHRESASRPKRDQGA